MRGISKFTNMGGAGGGRSGGTSTKSKVKPVKSDSTVYKSTKAAKDDPKAMAKARAERSKRSYEAAGRARRKEGDPSAPRTKTQIKKDEAAKEKAAKSKPAKKETFPKLAKGGKVRGCGMAKKGTRKAKTY